jgi:hypothetical protein
MRRLFRSFESFHLDYLLISGQASVLYGAATFSEDIDIWIRPTRANVLRLLESLASCRAAVYKLTPPLSPRNLRLGHAFHFVVPARPSPVYLDVMARPPRAGSFDRAKRRARRMTTPWGAVPVVSIADLIALKKTRRLADYDVISNLVLVRMSEVRGSTRALLRWAARYSFRVHDRVSFLRRLGVAAPAEKVRHEVLAEIARHQARDTAYWSRRLADLRRIRARGQLIPEGTPVSALLPSRPRGRAR